MSASAISAWTVELAQDLEAVQWDAAPDADPLVEQRLAWLYRQVGVFAAELARLAPEGFAQMLHRSRETSTHYKWYLCSGKRDEFVVWLHEYKPRTQRAPGYAESVHNHRYGLTSLILRGGYTHVQFRLEEADPGGTHVTQTWTRRLSAGMVYSLSADDFHRVADPADGTVTLVVQHPAVRPYSTSVDTAAGRLIRHYPIEARYAQLCALLT